MVLGRNTEHADNAETRRFFLIQKTVAMLFRLLLISMIFSCNNSPMNAQLLNDYRWENRIVLVMTNDETLETYQKQLQLLASSTEMKERKLLICKVMPNQYTLGLDNFDWIKTSELYRKFHSKNTDFEVILIGLDGGVKLRQTDILTTEKLFSTIDVMPMRRAELKRKN